MCQHYSKVARAASSESKKMPATIRDIARESGVSISTVSYVLNGGPKPVSTGVKERVISVAKRLGYHPNAVARGLSRRRMDTLGIIYTYWDVNTTDFYFLSVLHGILGACMRHKQASTLFTSRHWEESDEAVPQYSDGRCDGIIVIGPPEDCNLVQVLAERKVPTVVINAVLGQQNVSCVDVDNVASMKTITGHLLALGHKRIALLTGEQNMQSCNLRTIGFNAACDEFRIPISDRHIVVGRYRSDSGYERASRLMDLPEEVRPTAICCTNDAIASGVIAAVTDRGLRVPGDVSVTGFDDVADATMCRVPITTIRQPFSRLGGEAVSMLLQVLNGNAVASSTLLPTELVVRSSTAPPPQ